MRNRDLIYRVAIEFFSDYLLLRFYDIFTANFALDGTVNINRGILPSACVAAEYQHGLTGTSALGPQVNDPSAS